MVDEPGSHGMSRRGFLATSAGSSVLLASAEAIAQEAVSKVPAGPPVGCAVVGLGKQGREIVARLARVPGAQIASICDTYPAFLNRSKDAAPKAVPVADYRLALERKDVSSVFVATPSHQHKEIVLAALQAGKHVYCEAPIAHTVDEARTIAAAALKSGLTFSGGQQFRSNPQHLHVLKFIRGSVLGRPALARAQWHKKTSWRLAAPNPEREREINWRLRKESSPGLLGEIGIHSVDTVNWFWRNVPVSVQGFGGVLFHQDGRTVADTAQCVFEYPGGARFLYDSTLVNSFDSTYELLMGDQAAVLLRGERAWLFKEADAALEGWEVYARKEPVGDETGIALVADATKILALGKIPGKDGSTLEPGKDALYYAVEAFLECVRTKKPTVCGPREAIQATVTALKANEAVQTGSKVVYQKEWFELA